MKEEIKKKAQELTSVIPAETFLSLEDEYNKYDNPLRKKLFSQLAKRLKREGYENDSVIDCIVSSYLLSKGE